MKNDFTTILAIESYLKENSVVINSNTYLRDIDTAKMYNISLKTLRYLVKKNSECFPPDFIIEIPDNGYAFTYSGLMMLGGSAKSERAIRTNIQLIEYLVGAMKDCGMSLFDFITKEIK